MACMGPQAVECEELQSWGEDVKMAQFVQPSAPINLGQPGLQMFGNMGGQMGNPLMGVSPQQMGQMMMQQQQQQPSPNSAQCLSCGTTFQFLSPPGASGLMTVNCSSCQVRRVTSRTGVCNCRQMHTC